MKVTLPPGMLRDVVGIAGAGLLAYGFGLHYLPLGFIAGGSCLFVLAIAGTLRGDGPAPSPTAKAAEVPAYTSVDRR